jgi:hypothetical protein
MMRYGPMRVGWAPSSDDVTGLKLEGGELASLRFFVGAS